MSYRPRDWRYEREERPYGYPRERRNWREEPSASYSQGYSARRYDSSRSRSYRDYNTASSALSTSSYDRHDRDRSHRRESDARSRPYRGDDTARDRDGARPSRRDTHREGGVKDRDVGYALMSKEERSHVRRSLRPQLEAEENGAAPVSTELTPRRVVEEFKRAGHFDSIRKQLFLAFQASEQKKTFVDSLDRFLLRRLEDLSVNQRHRLASQDKRLQHSELNKWIEEDPTAAEAFQSLFLSLRPSASEANSESSSKDDKQFLDVGGKLAEDVHSRLSDLIQAERRRLHSNHANSESDDDDEDNDDDEDSVSTPAVVQSSVTPVGQETPRRSANVSSVGGQTPAQMQK